MCIVCAVGHVACLFCVCENRQFILCVNYSTAQFHSHSRLFTSLYESKCLMSVSIQALNWFRNICHILTWLRSIKKGSYICTIVHWIAASPEIPKQTFTSSHHTRSVWELHGNLCSYANKKLRTIGFGPPIHIQNTRIFAILHGKCLLQYRSSCVQMIIIFNCYSRFWVFFCLPSQPTWFWYDPIYVRSKRQKNCTAQPLTAN